MSHAQEKVLQRREVEQRLALGLLPPEAIAHELGLKTVSVKAHARRLRDAWSTRTSRAKTDWMPELIAVLDEVQRQAWIAWRRSLDFLAKSSRTTKELVSGTQEQTSIGRAEHLGDTRCLTIILHCVKLRCDLLGLGPGDIMRSFFIPDLPGLDALIARLPPDQLDRIHDSTRIVEDLVRQLGVSLSDDDDGS